MSFICELDQQQEYNLCLISIQSRLKLPANQEEKKLQTAVETTERENIQKKSECI